VKHPNPSTPVQGGDSNAGLVFAISAYVLWGFLPIFMKLLAHIPPAEVVAHRVIWSVPIAAAVLIVLGRTADIRAALASPRTILLGCLTAGLISVNWGIYVWAIGSGQALEAALGYYINPLFSMFLGAVFLGERLSRLQLVAIALAACAVAVLTFDRGGLPIVALALTLTWGLYALCKKALPIGPNQGFLLEVLILLFPALAYWGWLQSTGASHFSLGASDMWLLLGCGVVTAVPLLLYANGAKRLRLTTIAILQYIAPTMIFLVAVFLFDEPFGQARAVAFPMIWAAVAIYLLSVFRRAR
jgi:chloramphenicol-sensitive protein RarD